MKKLLLAALLLAALPRMGAAQVEKQVEVTKAYVPRVGSAAKLPVEPDMTDTTRIRPEIDYTITPLSLQTTLTTRPIRPATVTYWEFNRPQPFYLKAGAGYPLNSVLDFYASTQNPSTGYLIGYVNHEGRYADIENDFGGKYNSLRMYNRAGVAAGKYLGRHVLEGELSYDNRMFHRYGAWATPGLDLGERDFEPGRMNDYGDARLNIRIGDDFQNLERTNFEVGVGGSLFFDHSERDFDAAYGQTSLTACGRIARAFGRHMLSAGVGYDYLAGRRDLDGSNQQTIRAGLRYGIDGDVIRMEIGADFYHDRVESAADPDPIVKTGNYVIPYAHFDINLGTRSLKPFIEIDGDVRDNSFRSLAGANPFLSETAWLDRSSVDYNGRFGVGGTLGRDRFAYPLCRLHDLRQPGLLVCRALPVPRCIGRRTAASGRTDAGRFSPDAGTPDCHVVQRRAGIPSDERAEVRSRSARLYLQRRGALGQCLAVVRRKCGGHLRRPQDRLRGGGRDAELPHVECLRCRAYRWQ